MAAPPVDYNQIASSYDRRYAARPLEGVARALRDLVRLKRPSRTLEVGCGTGRWLMALREMGGWLCGLDLAMGMLQIARERMGDLDLTRGDAGYLPFAAHSFGLVLCVNALHHFPEPQRFIAEAHRLLGPGGVLAVIGMNPHGNRIRWYLYDYFEGTLAADQRRYPSAGAVIDWMAGAGFTRIEWQVVERIRHTFSGREVLGDAFLEKNSTSQLVLLSEETYAAGLQRIHKAIAQAEAAGESLDFQVDIQFPMITASA